MSHDLCSCRYLLCFGQVSQYLGYSALLDFFPTLALLPNPSCSDQHCCAQQQAVALETPKIAAVEVKESEEVVHEDNQWGECL